MIIYLNDILIMATSLEEILMSRDTVIFLLQHLGFLINLQKSKLEPNTKLEFWVVEINSVDVATYLSEEKITDITNLCKKHLLQEENTTLRELTSLIGKLISTYQAVLPTTLHCCSSQMYQITKLRANLCYEDKINLNAASLEELKWWCHNLNLNKGRPTKIQNAKIIIQLDAAKLGGWGAHCQGLTTGSQWSKTEAQTHINVLEMKAAKLSIESFCRVKKKQNQFTYKSTTSLGENGRNKEHRTQQNFEGKSGLLNWEQDQTYCRIPPKLSKQSGRSGIMPYQVLE